MSIYADLVIKGGLGLSEAYVKIYSVQMHFNRILVLNVKIYKDLEMKNIDSPVEERSFRIEGQLYDTYFSESVVRQLGKTYLTQGYAYLKTLTEFENCTDN